MRSEIEKCEFLHEPGQASSYNEVNRILSNHDFTITDHSSTSFVAKYNKCDSNLTIQFNDGFASVAKKDFGGISFLNLYNNGIIMNVSMGDYSKSFAYIAPESDGDTWVLIETGTLNQIFRIHMKEDEDEGWHDLYDDAQPFPSLNGIQIVNYYNFMKQKMYGNIYICKKLPPFRTFNRKYFSNNAEIDTNFPDSPYDKLINEQHWNVEATEINAAFLFSERIKIDEKVFIICYVPLWDYSNNPDFNPGPDSELPKGWRTVPLAIRVS